MKKTSIYFKYGCMNSGKSLELIKVAYNYQENDIQSLILKPILDTRMEGKIFSRTNLSIDAVEIEQDNPEHIRKMLEQNIDEAKVILIDEANFLTKESVDVIIDYAYDMYIETIMFFGLKVDFRGNLFEGSKRIIERADKIEESTSICWCGKKARQNARIINNKIVKEGDTILVDDGTNEIRYAPLCNYHFYKEILNPE